MPTFAIDSDKLVKLLRYCTGFAKRMIQEDGELFYPFGAVVAASGQLAPSITDMEQEFPKESEVYSILVSSMKSRFQKREIIACAIADGVNIPAQYQPMFPDGIRVLLECAGYARFVYVPYHVSGDSVSFAKAIPIDVRPRICL